MRKDKFLVRVFLTQEYAASIFGKDLVAKAQKFRFFKKNFRVRTEDLVEMTALAKVPLASSKVAGLMTYLPEKLKSKTNITPKELKEVYSDFRKDYINKFSEASFLSGEEVAYLLHSGVCSVYITEKFPEAMKLGISQVKRWPIKSVLGWAENAVYIPPSKPKKKTSSNTKREGRRGSKKTKSSNTH